MHVAVAVLAAYVPEAHGWHCTACAPEYSPAAQAAGASEAEKAGAQAADAEAQATKVEIGQLNVANYEKGIQNLAKSFINFY